MAGSMIMPGLGQVYNGELAKGLSLFLIFAFVIPIFSYVAVHGPASSMMAFVLAAVVCGLGIYGYCIYDAYASARKIASTYRAQAYNQPHVYAALLFFGYFFVLGQLSSYVQRDLIQAFKIPPKGASMTPNILPGDQLFADKRINTPGAHKILRGDPAIFVYPNDRTTIFIKRVIGLPGDEVEIRGADVFVNGKPIRGDEVKELGSAELDRMLEDHVAYKEHGEKGDYVVLWKRDRRSEPQKLTVPNGSVFVLGDNRDDSLDSRSFGPVSLTDLIGRARQVWFSSAAGRVRFERIGLRLDSNG
jgi:signal peptidase I